MPFVSEIFSLFCVLVFISNLDFGSPMGKMYGGGGGIVYISNNKPSPLGNKPNDMLLITQKGCSPTVIKNTYKGKDMLILGECNYKKKIKKEYIPIPVPVKQYIPVPMKKHMGGMYGMDTKKSVIHTEPENNDNTTTPTPRVPPLKKRVQLQEQSSKRSEKTFKRVRKVSKND